MTDEQISMGQFAAEEAGATVKDSGLSEETQALVFMAVRGVSKLAIMLATHAPPDEVNKAVALWARVTRQAMERLELEQG